MCRQNHLWLVTPTQNLQKRPILRESFVFLPAWINWHWHFESATLSYPLWYKMLISQVLCIHFAFHCVSLRSNADTVYVKNHEKGIIWGFLNVSSMQMILSIWTPVKSRPIVQLAMLIFSLGNVSSNSVEKFDSGINKWWRIMPWTWLFL